MKRFRAFAAGWIGWLLQAVVVAAPPSPADLEFFEAKVRPLLVTRCGECHTAGKTPKGGLALDSKAGWERGGDTGPALIPGKPEESLLIRAVDFEEDGYEMPPAGKLPEAERAILREWVRRGAPDPRVGAVAIADPPRIDLAAGRRFWSFRPLSNPPVPQPKNRELAAGDYDRFLLAAAEKQGLSFAPETSPERLLRRLHYDLTGLPPTPSETAAFVARRNRPETREAALTETVDRLLASPAFGEKWGRRWLDLARYADSNGASFNVPYSQAWRYRNWVVSAFRRDLPYDRFLRMQLAGDLLPWNSQEERDENLIATGFLLLGSKVLGEFDKEQLRLDVIDEQLDTIGKSMLGLTLGCARCHDHKFDPIPQRDYYALAGILAGTVTLEDRIGGPKEDESDWSRRGLGAGGDERLRQFLARHRYEWAKTGTKASAARRKIDVFSRQLAAATTEDERIRLRKALEEARTALAPLAARLRELESELPPYAEAVRDAESPVDERLRIRGMPSAPGAVVPRGFLQVASFANQPVPGPHGSGRKELAEWIAADENPLTARVYVNRVQGYLFGEGFVRSVDNFGVRGDLPTHPELLDHLTRKFIAGGWKIKPLIREIVTSRAYRTGVRPLAEAAESDPENRLLMRQNLRRLEPEEIRDTLLHLAGTLDPRPAENLLSHLPLKDIDGSDAAALEVRDSRRTIYQPVVRTMEPDVLQIFDFANPAVTTGKRPATIVAPQALYFMNAPFVEEAALGFARRLNSPRDSAAEGSERELEPLVREAFRTAICREPSPAETTRLVAYLRKQFESEAVGPTLHDLTKFCRLLLGTTQFQYLD